MNIILKSLIAIALIQSLLIGCDKKQDYYETTRDRCDNKNSILACEYTSEFYFFGKEGAKKNIDKANYYFEKACGLGSGYGCFSLGQSYQFSRGVTENITKALELYIKSCNIYDESSGADACQNVSAIGLFGTSEQSIMVKDFINSLSDEQLKTRRSAEIEETKTKNIKKPIYYYLQK